MKPSYICKNLIYLCSLWVFGLQASCILPSDTELFNERVQGAIAAYKALSIPFNKPESIWSSKELSRNPQLKNTLSEYIEGRRGQSLQGIVLSQHSVEELHAILLSKKFRHSRVPLAHWINGSRLYCQLDGTLSPTYDLNTTPQDIYIHDDGGMVRLKPRGIPCKHPQLLRRLPHGAKCVLFDVTPVCQNAHCELDTSYANEAFKISDQDLPVPKGIASSAGIKIAPAKAKDACSFLSNQAYMQGWLNAIMDAAHSKLALDDVICCEDNT